MQNRFSLVMETSAGTGWAGRIGRSRTVIGRQVTSDIRVPIPTVEPRHCELTLTKGVLRITDLGSTLGTLVNGERVREAVLSPADRITVGPTTFRVQIENDDARIIGWAARAAAMAEIKVDPRHPVSSRDRTPSEA